MRLRDKEVNYAWIAARLPALRVVTRTGGALRAKQVKGFYLRTTASVGASLVPGKSGK